MDKATVPVQGGTKEEENPASTGRALESATQSTTTQRSPNQLSVQNNASPKVETPRTNQQEQTKSSQPQRQSSTQATAADTDPNQKKTRQRLRKGKWTIEEEEYTSRIIQYFSTGLLTLPDGATLRSYLAEKLNCDPMRITKKFTGACCLGRRAYHLRDRPRASPAEIEMASLELLHLEQRFRLRVEHEQTGLPLPPRHEILASQPTTTAAVVPSLFTLQQGAPAVKAGNQWIQNPIVAPSPGHSMLLPGLAGIIPNATVPGANANINLQNSQLLLAAGQLLLQNQNPSERTQAGNSSSSPATAPLQILNNLVASYALSRAISQQQAGLSILQQPGISAPHIHSTAPKIPSPSSAPPTSSFNVSLPHIATDVATKSSQTPVVVQSQEQVSKNFQSHLQQQNDKINSSASSPQVSKKEEHTKKLKAAFEEQQRALRMAYEKSLKDAQEREEKMSSSTAKAISASKGTQPATDANTTSSNSEKSLDAVSPAEQLQRSYEAHLASLKRAEQEASLKAVSKSSSQTKPASGTGVEGNEAKTTKTEGDKKSSKKESQDEEAGAILLGFLNSLRESFDDAVAAKDGQKGAKEKTIASAERKKVTGDPDMESIPAVQLESSTVMTEVSSDSSNDHPHISVKSGSQASDPISTLSHFQSSKRKVKPASITETSSSTSSQPTIEQPSSSQEDSKSDKMGSSSSEESEKETTASRKSSKGPPRKRLKGFHEPHEFTRENLMAHSKRMDMECGRSGDASSSDE